MYIQHRGKSIPTLTHRHFEAGRLLMFILPLIITLTGFDSVRSQIKFSTWSDDEIVLTLLHPEQLSFRPLIINDGLTEIQLGDPEMVVLAITGVEYYDVIVTIDAPAELVLDGEHTIPFTLKTAYANRGQNTIADATLINGDAARFQIRRRGTGPPGPPPTPGHEGYIPPQSTAYLYLYGSVTVGNIPTGEYTGTVNILVEYE